MLSFLILFTYLNFDKRNLELFYFLERQPIEAMFQGTQYLTYDLTWRGDSFYSRNDELRMQFKTTQMNGLLFYTGKPTASSID